MIQMKQYFSEDSLALERGVYAALQVHIIGDMASVAATYKARLDIAFETFNADDIYISGIWKRVGWTDDLLLNPVSKSMITDVSRLIGKITGKWIMVKAEQIS